MTAEICLMNRMGVALATDSAVTLGGGESPKIYNSADKLFLLTEHAPVGVMIYGGASVNGVPWETLIKLYRSRSKSPLATVEAYADDLLKFLETNLECFPAAGQEGVALAHTVLAFRKIRVAVETSVNQRMAQGGAISGKELPALIASWAEKALLSFEREIAARPRLARPIDKQALVRRYQTAVRTRAEELFKHLPVGRSFLERIADVVIEALGRAAFTTHQSGVVVAGFGKNDILPSMVSMQIDDVVADHVRYQEGAKKSISHQHTAWVIPFAQSEMVHSFMEGIDPGLDRLIQEFVDKVYRALPEAFASCANLTLGKKLKDQLDTMAGEVLTKMWGQLREERFSNFVLPVTHIVSYLPKDELAAMAEALVNLTSLRRRVSTDAETVGGPIDVAIITKGDGFVWIRRKHYFDPTLNPRYIARHYR